MKNSWLQLIVLLFLLLAQALPAQAAQAVAYATILIVIPPRPEATGQVQQAKEEIKADKEKGAIQERVLLAEEQKEEVKTSE